MRVSNTMVALLESAIRFSATITNTGEGETADGGVTIYTSSEPAIDSGPSDTMLWRSRVTRQTCWKRWERTVRIDASTPVAGDYYYGACVTSGADSAKHCFTSSERVAVVTLRVDDVTIPTPASAIAGVAVAFSVDCNEYGTCRGNRRKGNLLHLIRCPRLTAVLATTMIGASRVTTAPFLLSSGGEKNCTR